ncbi:MAG TPA: hypothetical protein PLT58_00395 [Atribacterota bacterium]|nr:hypothetical protein [Atribacterota bacterium]
MRAVRFRSRRKRQKRCYREGRQKNRKHGNEVVIDKAVETDELWEDENLGGNNRKHNKSGRRRVRRKGK